MDWDYNGTDTSQFAAKDIKVVAEAKRIGPSQSISYGSGWDGRDFDSGSRAVGKGFPSTLSSALFSLTLLAAAPSI